MRGVVSQARFDDHVVDSDECVDFEQWVDDEWDTLVGIGNDRIRDYQLPGIASRQEKAAAKAARKRTARTIAKRIVSFGQWT